MSLRMFQRALADLVASPELYNTARATPESVWARYELTPRECTRLASIVQQQRGMRVNMGLYRSNRLSPLVTMLPLTSFLLGDDLEREVNLYWASHQETDLQYAFEVIRFGAYIQERVRSDAFEEPLIGDIVAVELALHELRYGSGDGRFPASPNGHGTQSAIQMHSSIRLVSMRSPPEETLRLLAQRQHPPYDLSSGEFWLLIDGRTSEAAVHAIDSALATAIMGAIDGRRINQQTNPALRNLIELGFLVEPSAPA